MKNIRYVVVLSIILCISIDIQAQSSDIEISAIIKEFQKKSQAGLDTKALIVSAAIQFLNTPYIGGTLEGNNEELRINLKGQDCVTFVEYAMALACTNDVDSFKSFIANLRYNGKEMDGFASRMHYLSQWLESLERMKIYHNFSRIGNKTTTITYSFMSDNIQYYPKLKDEGSLKVIKLEENRLNKEKKVFKYFRFNDLDESKLAHGDIVGFISKKKGLDFDHLGIVYVTKNGDRKLLHASLDFKKVMITKENLSVYLRNHKKFLGMAVIN